MAVADLNDENMMAFFNEVKDAYVGVFLLFKRYWRDYGGIRAFLSSPYLHISILLTYILSEYWSSGSWISLPLSVLPNVIGFALGGYAIWLGFGDEKFRQLISEKSKEEEISPYMQVSAAFSHFIIIQIITLLYALILTGFNSKLGTYTFFVCSCLFNFNAKFVFNFIGFFLFIYSLFTALAATMAIFRVATWFDKFRNTK